MTTLALGPVIGKIGGGRESQEIALTMSDQTITLGEGRWLLTGTGISFNLDGTNTTPAWKVVQGEATHRVSSITGSGTLYVTPLTD